MGGLPMDCKTARLLLIFAGSASELGSEETTALESHLGECTECRDLADAERHLDARLGRAMQNVAVPDKLRGMLLTRLAAERDAYYRRLLVRVAGVAALVMVVIGAGWYFLARPTSVELNDLRAQAGRQRFQCRLDQVQAWLEQNAGPHLTAPADFQYDLLIDFGLQQIKGRKVPYLLFARSERGEAFWARVYILDRAHFDLEQFREDAKAISLGDGLPKAEILAGPDNRVAYVVVYTGDLKPFQKQPAPIAHALVRVRPANTSV
jgi:hypothetical protein